MRIMSLAVALALIGVTHASAQEGRDWLTPWARALADRLARFIPDPGPVYIADPYGQAGPRYDGGPGEYASVRVSAGWVHGDSALVRLARRKAELERCFVECPGRADFEGVQRAMEELPRVSARLDSLRPRTQTVVFAIQANPVTGGSETPDAESCEGDRALPARKRLDATAGYPLSRNDHCGSPTVTLDVEVGATAGYENRVSAYANPGDGRREVRLIRVTVDAPLALEKEARRLLARVDYAALAQLVTR